MAPVHKLTAAATVALTLMLAGCSSFSQLPCAGQCRAPFELDVWFHQGVSGSRGIQALKECEHLPGVVRVSWNRTEKSAVVWTTFFGPKAPSQNEPLRSCLKRLPSVAGQGWPD